MNTLEDALKFAKQLKKDLKLKYIEIMKVL